MLSNLQIKNFRMISDLSVPKLGRVNLIVGKNNSGKSTLLEAIKVFANAANPDLLDELIRDHDENLMSQNEPRMRDEVDRSSYRNFFPGREFPEDESQVLFIGANDNSDVVEITRAHYVMETTETNDPTGEKYILRKRVRVAKDQPFESEPATPALLVAGTRLRRPTWIDLDLGPTGMRRNSRSWEELSSPIPVSHIPTQFLSADLLAHLWDGVALRDDDQLVTGALKIIDDQVTGIAFVKNTGLSVGARRATGDRTAIVKLNYHDLPVPLSSMGDGMLRLLQFILSIFPARNGIFLIDEFENGLHYSIQGQVWELIFKLASVLNVQVFATTHSRDCIEAFKNAAVNSPDDGVLIRVGRSILRGENGKVMATVFAEKELDELTHAEVELR